MAVFGEISLCQNDLFDSLYLNGKSVRPEFYYYM